MPDRHFTDLYTRLFGAFLRHTDEKQVLLRSIGRVISERNPDSIVDIGARSGELAFPLSKLVPRYVAVEQKPEYVLGFRRASIPVIESAFPASVDGTFDLVLVSHSAPWWKEEYDPFLRAAYDLMSERGALLVITYDNNVGSWKNFLSRTGLTTDKRNEYRIRDLVDWMWTLGEVDRRNVISEVSAENADDMREALAFMYSDGDETKARRFMESESVTGVLEDYRREDRYVMPFQHEIFLLAK